MQVAITRHDIGEMRSNNGKLPNGLLVEQMGYRGEQAIEFPIGGGGLLVVDRLGAVNKVARQFLPQRILRVDSQMRRDEPVHSRGAFLGGAGEEAKPLRLAAELFPGVGEGFAREFGVALLGQEFQPGPGDAFRRQERGELEHGSSRFAEGFDHRFEDRPEELLLVVDLGLGVGVDEIVGAWQALGAKAGQIISRSDLGIQAEEDRDLLDGQREAAEFADDLLGVFLVLGRLETAFGEVVDDQPQGVFGVERVDLDRAELLSGGVERARVEAGRGDDPQPVGLGELAQLRRREQFEIGDVVEDQQGGGGMVRIVKASLLGAAGEFEQDPASEKIRVFFLGVVGRVAEFRHEPEFSDQGEEFLLGFRLKRPEAEPIRVGIAAGIGDGQFGFPLAAEAMNRRDQPDLADADEPVEFGEFVVSSHEIRGHRANIPRNRQGPARALDAFPNVLPKSGHLLLDGLFGHLRRAGGKPGAEVDVVFGKNRRQPLGVLVLVGLGNLDEVDRGVRVGTDQVMVLAALVFVPFPLAGFALKIVGRQAYQEHLRAPQATEDAVPPVVHVADFLFVEEDAQGGGFILAVVGEDLFLQGRNPAVRIGFGYRLIIRAGIRDEEFIRRLILTQGGCSS